MENGYFGSFPSFTRIAFIIGYTNNIIPITIIPIIPKPNNNIAGMHSNK